LLTFADFEIDERAGVLRRGGARIKLQDLPFRMLVVLVRRPGEVVTREELRAALWGAETFVDAEAGLNTAIAKIREALGDNADTPAFIETLPKRGYRFMGSVGHAELPPARVDRPRRWPWALAGLVLIAVVVAAYSMTRAGRITIAVVHFHNETGAAENDRLADTLTDAVVVALAEHAEYGVIGNSPLLRTDRMFEDVRTIGEALHADFVVLGQLQNGDSGLLTRAHFIRVSDQKHFWAGKVDLPPSGVERAVTAAIVDGVGVGVSRSR